MFLQTAQNYLQPTVRLLPATLAHLSSLLTGCGSQSSGKDHYPTPSQPDVTTPPRSRPAPLDGRDCAPAFPPCGIENHSNNVTAPIGNRSLLHFLSFLGRPQAPRGWHPHPRLPCSIQFATLVSSLPPGASAAVHAKRPQEPGPSADSDRGGTAGSGGRAGRDAAPPRRPKGDLVKEMHLKPRIAEHDLGYKLRQMEGWLADGIRTKLVVEFRGADQSEAAAALVDSVVGRLAGKAQPLGQRQQNKDVWFVILRPVAAKTPKKATAAAAVAPQQSEQPPPDQHRQQEGKSGEEGKSREEGAPARGGAGGAAAAA